MSLHEKLLQVHAAIRQPVKDGYNPHFNSSFASLNECTKVVAEAVRSVEGCDYWQRAVYNPEASCWEMQTVFCADGEEVVLSTHPFRDNANPQQTASATTYARRYSLQSAFNLAAEDDDGMDASMPIEPANEQTNDVLRIAYQRMGDAIEGWCRRHGCDSPEEIQAKKDGVKKRPEWPSQCKSLDYINSLTREFQDA